MDAVRSGGRVIRAGLHLIRVKLARLRSKHDTEQSTQSGPPSPPGMKSSFSGARVVQKDVVKLARKQVATVAAVSVPEGVTIEKMGKVRLETRKPCRRGTFHSPREVSSPAGRHPRRGSGRRRG